MAPTLDDLSLLFSVCSSRARVGRALHSSNCIDLLCAAAAASQGRVEQARRCSFCLPTPFPRMLSCRAAPCAGVLSVGAEHRRSVCVSVCVCVRLSPQLSVCVSPSFLVVFSFFTFLLCPSFLFLPPLRASPSALHRPPADSHAQGGPGRRARARGRECAPQFLKVLQLDDEAVKLLLQVLLQLVRLAAASRRHARCAGGPVEAELGRVREKGEKMWRETERERSESGN